MKQQPYPLNYHHDYLCPLCRQGRIHSIALMDAFACDCCQHIFSADVEQQTLTAVDTQLPMTWQWNQKTWTRVNPEGVNFGWLYLVLGILWVLLPTTIVGLASYLFPPLPGSSLAWLPWFWTVVTFLSHLLCLVWLILEYYQFPVRVYLRFLLR
ncbi:MAG: hypothetical protein EA365_07410 [Gloeocapsa sp. DLM2.Bin57]|nr:MAG: hypothetical protein EA365_07410 [Gloeocapsa sp. DLM2.Bin57]